MSQLRQVTRQVLIYLNTLSLGVITYLKHFSTLITSHREINREKEREREQEKEVVTGIEGINREINREKERERETRKREIELEGEKKEKE